MTGPHPAVAATRVAVRRVLAQLARELVVDYPSDVQASAQAREPLVLSACSGGADSLALAAATAFEAPRLREPRMRAGAIVVDHGLQAGSAQVAQRAAQQCRAMGLDPVDVVRVDVGAGPGPEAAAREARYRAYDEAVRRHGAAAVLLGHTRDDQAEQVLLGLVRGSGTRSIAGMPARRDAVWRPFLGITRGQISQACRAQGLTPWQDPHNDDERFTRVRARRLLARLRAELDPAIDAALARTADLARADADALDAYARALIDGPDARPPGPGCRASDWGVGDLDGHPEAVRGRVWRLRAARLGIGNLSSAHVVALERLSRRRGVGPVSLPGGARAVRVEDRIHMQARGRVE
ncbi:MAG: tRNA lysidine(34) synthetase TilS [Micrococcales bacterium]|nr:tRNA lysidine(34) synthetase TilS [Micrococcales bacterium]